MGEVPAHWRVVPTKHVAAIVNGVPFDSALFDADEGVPVVRIRDLNKRETESRYKGEFVEAAAITSDDVLIGMDGDFNVGRWLGCGKALLNQRMCCVRGHTDLITRLLEYFLPIPLRVINDTTFSTTVKHLSSYQVGKIPVAIPEDKSEQQSIISFLDCETAKVDALIAELHRLIELLKEKRRAVAGHAVTKGLNSPSPTKPSGIEWLGDVPAHWTVTRLGTLFKEVSELGRDNLPILSVSIHDGVSDRELDEEELERKITRSDDRSKYKRVAVRDLVYNMMRAWQGAFGTVAVDGMVSPAYVVARPRTDLPTAFIELLLRTPKAVEEMRRHSHGVTDFRLRLYWNAFKEIRVAIPPRAEAIKICQAIAALDEQFAAVSTDMQASITLLQERRTALISAAVTGKIDVRGLAEANVEAA